MKEYIVSGELTAIIEMRIKANSFKEARELAESWSGFDPTGDDGLLYHTDNESIEIDSVEEIVDGFILESGLPEVPQ